MEELIFNDIRINKTNVDRLYDSTLPANHWLNEVHAFLKDWFSEDDCVVVSTSGSTGIPKKIFLPKLMMRVSARMTNRFFGMKSDSKALLCLPASYIAGKMMIVRAIEGGYKLLAIQPSSNPFLAVSEPVDFSAITPYQLVHSAETLRNGLVSKIIVGGAPVTLQTESLCATLPPALYETYGMTETASHIALRRFNGTEKSDFFETLEGVAVSADDRGCLVIDAPHLTSERLITNDLSEIIDINHFRWLGRADRVINSGGVKIFPEQVEKKLGPLLDVPYFVTGFPDLELGQKVVLVMESETYPRRRIADMKQDMEALLSKYECPKEFVFLPKFVYSASDKLLRDDTLRQNIPQVLKS